MTWEEGDIVSLKQGHNKYKVLRIQDKNAELQCVQFHGPEELGDGIQCTRQNGKTWIAHEFHGYKFQKELQ